MDDRFFVLGMALSTVNRYNTAKPYPQTSKMGTQGPHIKRIVGTGSLRNVVFEAREANIQHRQSKQSALGRSMYLNYDQSSWVPPFILHLTESKLKKEGALYHCIKQPVFKKGIFFTVYFKKIENWELNRGGTSHEVRLM